MEIESDVSATFALIHTTMEVEMLHMWSPSLDFWQSKLGEINVPATVHPAQSLHGDEHEYHEHKHRQHPIKIVPPPPTITLDSATLVDHIISL